MNSNWPRWFEASIAKVFAEAAVANGILLYVEGMDRSALRNQSKFIELRIDGPYASELSKNYWQVDMEVNVVVTTIPRSIDHYEHATLLGQAGAIFPDPLKIYKYGPDTAGVDDGTQLGCMAISPIVSGDRPIRFSRFGQIAPDTKVIQSTVEVHYRGEFDG